MILQIIEIPYPLQITSLLLLTALLIFYVVKTFGTKYINSKIDSKFATALETHKIELQKEAKQQEIQFSKLREVQMPIFNEFHELILKTFKTCSDIRFTAEQDPKKFQKRKEMREKILTLISAFEIKKIYLNSKLSDLIEKFILEMTCVYLNSENLEPNSVEETRQSVRNQIADAGETKEKIVLEIKALIGV